MSGKAHITLGSTLNKLQSSLTKKMVDPLDPAVEMSYSYPWMFRAGARYVLRSGSEEVGDIEADFVGQILVYAASGA